MTRPPADAPPTAVLRFDANGPPLSSLPDDELVRHGRAGAEAALTELYQRYRPRVMRYVVRMTGDPDLAEEVFCSTFAAFFGSLHRYRPEGRLTAYLFQIARSKLARECVSRKRLGTPLPPPDEGSECRPEPCMPGSAPDASASGSERAALVRRALASLPAHLREVVVLRLFDGLDYIAIGEISGTSAVTARSRMRYALRALQDDLSGLQGD